MLKQIGFVPVIALKNPIARTTLPRSRVAWMATASPAGRLRELAAGTRRGAMATPEARKLCLCLCDTTTGPYCATCMLMAGFLFNAPRGPPLSADVHG
jgi:hypothetical protein